MVLKLFKSVEADLLKATAVPVPVGVQLFTITLLRKSKLAEVIVTL